MRDLAPDIVRQRLLVEGLYDIDVDACVVATYLRDVAAHLSLRTYGEPVVHAPGGMGRADNAGFDAFIPLIDSGIALYVWTERRFFSAVLYTCKRFDAEAATQFTASYFRARDIVAAPF